MVRKSVAREGKKSPRRAKKRLDITVLMGGPSLEREVSLVSGEAIADALVRLGHKVTRADISPIDTAALDRPGIDLVFVALHGQFGESGDVQALCEVAGLRYTGSGPRASELAMDKAASKQEFKRAGLSTPDWIIPDEFDSPRDINRLIDRLGLPLVLKPLDGGSSVDITIAKDAATRDEALDALLDKYARCMVEKFIRGREFTVGILGEEALPVLEVLPSREFYDYTAKYSDDGGTEYIFDHGLGTQQIAILQKAALTAHHCLRCRDMSRVDFILDEHGVPQVLEINTIPGFTGHSLLPMAAARAGLSFDKLVERIVAMAMNR